MRSKWFKDCWRQVHMDFHMPEFPAEAIRNFNAKAFVDCLERGRINMVALFAKCHFGNAFYNTSVGHKHAGLPQDFLMEAATECRRRGIRTMAYYSLFVDKRAWDENPAWRWKNAAGETFKNDSFWALVCMNTPYKDELVMPQIEEIAHYPVDGLWLDMPWGKEEEGCYCDSCKRRWATELGLDLSKPLPPVLEQQLQTRTIETYLREVRAIIDRVNPELEICLNGAGNMMTAPTVHALCEIGTWESQPHPGDYLTHSFAARTARNDTLDVQVMSVRFHSGWGDLTLKPAAQMTTEFAAVIGNGMPAVSGDQVNVDGTLQAPVYEMFREAFGFVEAREKILQKADSVRHAMVLIPVRDERLPYNGELIKTPQGAFFQAVRGAHKLLVESHIQADLIYSNLADDLTRYPMIILPEPPTYPVALYERLRRYVEEGGILVAVGSSLLAEGKCQLEDVFGIRFLEPLSFKTAHFVPAPAVKGATDAIPLQVRGPVFKIQRAGAEELAALYYPMAEDQGAARRQFRATIPPAAFHRSPYAFATMNRFGRGKAVYVAASLFSIYWRENHHWLRQFGEALLRRVDPNMPYEVDAPPTVEANLMRTGDDLLLNLIQYALGHQSVWNVPAIERVEPIHDIKCRVRCTQVRDVVVEPEGVRIPFQHEQGVCSFVVPKVQYIGMVRLVGAGK